MGRSYSLDWRGRRLLKTAGQAAVAGARETLEACVERAKRDHGWANISNTAEDSIQVGHVEQTAGGVDGQWGSYGADAYYFEFLETGTSSITADDTLRRAADAEYPLLAERIRAHMEG